MESIQPAPAPLIRMAPVPQIVPARACFACEVCCRFPDSDSFLRPYFAADEIDRAVERGIDAAHFPNRNGSRIDLVPNSSGEGYLCPAFDPATSRCTIYEVRPLDCRLYPLALMWSADGTEVVLGWDSKCPFLVERGRAYGAREGFPHAERPSERTIGAHADRTADLLEQDHMLDRLADHPHLVGRFQDDVVIVRTLPRLTARLKALSSAVSMLAPLTFDERPLLDRAVEQIDTALSAYAFAPHFVWRRLFQYGWRRIAGHLCLFAEYGDGLYMPLPPLGPGPLSEPLAEAFALMRTRNRSSAVGRVENISDELRPEFERLGYRVRPKDGDYLYRIRDLVDLAGDRYKSQRAAYNRLLRRHRVQYRPYDERDGDACLALFRQWTTQLGAITPTALQMVNDSESAHREALVHYRRLSLTGRVVCVDGTVRAYTFGYRLRGSVFCVLFEIADRTINGLSQYIFREFCREAATEGFAFINTLDDSGLEGLRRSKHAYRPCRLVSNYVATEP